MNIKITTDYAKGMARSICSQLYVEKAHPAYLNGEDQEIYQETLTTHDDSFLKYLEAKIEEFLESGVSSVDTRKELLQIVIEDVPLKYQDRLLKYLS